MEMTRKVLEIHPTIIETLNELQDRLGLETHPEVMERAIQVLHLITDDGRRSFFIETPKGTVQEIKL
jgi:hypothetical protein